MRNPERLGTLRRFPTAWPRSAPPRPGDGAQPDHLPDEYRVREQLHSEPFDVEIERRWLDQRSKSFLDPVDRQPHLPWRHVRHRGRTSVPPGSPLAQAR